MSVTTLAERRIDRVAEHPPALERTRRAGQLVVTNTSGSVTFDLARPVVSFAGFALRCEPTVAGADVGDVSVRIAIDDPTLVRVVHEGTLGTALRFRTTYDVFQTSNVHVYVRLEAEREVELRDLVLPRVVIEGDALRPAGERAETSGWLELAGAHSSLGVIVKKLPWKASWNDIGCHNHRSLSASALGVASGKQTVVELKAPDRTELGATDTVEAAIMLRGYAKDDRAPIIAEASYGPIEAKYVPEGEYLHGLVWETDEVWLGPPITEGAPQRPHDQLIPRPLGLDVLARKRFTWNNEDFGLWRLTGKDRYWESGIKKAHALLATQNDHGGWFEGIEFYNLPPRHHQMYDTYIGGLFLLEAYDATGSETFLSAARRCKDFWLGAPPANGHTVVGNGGWWYRWGGYINEFGYTDDRHVLNTHAGATEFLAQLYERTGDEDALEAVKRGVDAFKWGLERGIQKGDGQFYYCLSQLDPRLELPGDPPYVQRNLVPQIEDVYTVASSYRLMMANRIIGDDEVTAAIGRALDYWWTGYRDGSVITYRAYAVIAYALAAGEIDPRYALALPELLKDPELYTSMQRGLSSFIAPAGLPGLHVEVQGPAAACVEPVFIRRRQDEFVFALVNMEFGQSGLKAMVDPPAGRPVRAAAILDPASGHRTPIATENSAGRVEITVPDLPEFGVALVEVAH